MNRKHSDTRGNDVTPNSIQGPSGWVLNQVQHDADQLLTPDFLRKLEQLSLVARKVFPGRLRGERRSTKRGASVEFADHRNYAVGDDFRRVDWNVYARVEKLIVKLFVEEEDLHVYALVDVSRSMDFGSPSKLLFAKRTAAALSYIALSNLDRAGLATLRDGGTEILRPKRGRQSASQVFEWLSSWLPSGKTDLASSLREFSLHTSQPGLAILISDLYDDSYRDGLSALLARGFEVVLMHVLDREEVEPTMVGDLELIDSESGDRREITVTQSLLRGYRRRFAAFCQDIESYCTKHGCTYVRVTSDTPFEDFVLSYLRQVGSLS